MACCREQTKLQERDRNRERSCIRGQIRTQAVPSSFTHDPKEEIAAPLVGGWIDAQPMDEVKPQARSGSIDRLSGSATLTCEVYYGVRTATLVAPTVAPLAAKRRNSRLRAGSKGTARPIPVTTTVKVSD